MLREAIFVDESTIDFPIFSYFLIQRFLFSQSWDSYFPVFLSNHVAGHPANEIWKFVEFRFMPAFLSVKGLCICFAMSQFLFHPELRDCLTKSQQNNCNITCPNFSSVITKPGTFVIIMLLLFTLYFSIFLDWWWFTWQDCNFYQK